MKYYVLERGGNNNNPLVGFKGRSTAFSKPYPMKVENPVELILRDPVPRNPEMIDYHSMGGEHLMSAKIKDVLEPLKIDGVQLVPGIVNVNGTQYDYWILHVYKEIECLDKEFSVLYIDESDGDILDVSKISLNTEELATYSDYKRLIFRIEEYSSIILFHEKIKKAIMDVDPIGFRFIPVEEWNDGSAFD